MAKAKTESKSKVKATKKSIVTIQDLVDEYGIKPNKLRALIRKLGFKAPPTEQEGFGPRTKYEWASNSKDLDKIRKALDATASVDEAEPEEEDEEE